MPQVKNLTTGLVLFRVGAGVVLSVFVRGNRDISAPGVFAAGWLVTALAQPHH